MTEIKSAEEVIAKGSLTNLFAMSLIGGRENWPYIFLGNYDNEIKFYMYNLEFGENAKTKEDLDKAVIIEKFNLLISEMRAIIQKAFDSLIAPTINDHFSNILQHRVDTGTEAFNNSEGFKFLKKEREKEKAGKEFIKNNTVDYGTETVAQIAQRLNISKAEVRRRKQNNEL